MEARRLKRAWGRRKHYGLENIESTRHSRSFFLVKCPSGLDVSSAGRGVGKKNRTSEKKGRWP